MANKQVESNLSTGKAKEIKNLSGTLNASGGIRHNFQPAKRDVSSTFKTGAKLLFFTVSHNHPIDVHPIQVPKIIKAVPIFTGTAFFARCEGLRILFPDFINLLQQFRWRPD